MNVVNLNLYLSVAKWLATNFHNDTDMPQEKLDLNLQVPIYIHMKDCEEVC